MSIIKQTTNNGRKRQITTANQLYFSKQRTTRAFNVETTLFTCQAAALNQRLNMVVYES